MSEPRLEREAALRCHRCAAVVYWLYRRQASEPTGELRQAFEHVLWPARPEIPPPRDSAKLLCPTCGNALNRVSV